MSKLRKLSDKAFFILLCVVLLTLFVFFKSWNFKFGGGPGIGTGPGTGNGQQSDDPQKQGSYQSPDSPEQKSPRTPSQPSPGPSKIARLYLGRQGVSEDQVKWYDMEQFADFIRQLKDKGIKEVYYTLLEDSIERYEEKWREELKKAKMTSAELQNDTETD